MRLFYADVGMFKIKRITAGILAHVDSGKTTLSEALLYLAGEIRRAGRVDHGDSFLDNDALERSRGITIFSKQAVIHAPDIEITLLDTPGHIDFSAEMERTLSVLDYAILVISGTDGVQSHTETLWKLLKRYAVPAFIFVNKMDISYLDKSQIMDDIKDKLSYGCVDFSLEKEKLYELLAECDEDVMNIYLESGEISEDVLKDAVKRRNIFPCFFGSSLKGEGIEFFFKEFCRLAAEKEYPKEFGARVYKITKDANGARLTHLKVTGGTLKVKDSIGEGEKKEKINGIRVYSGVKYTSPEEVKAGTICAVTGLNFTYAGEGLGREGKGIAPLLEPVLTYKVITPEGTDIPKALNQLRQLEEEDPQLKIRWDERRGEIQIKLMGDIQLEILKSIIPQRFGLNAEFDKGSIAYKETIASPVVGAGHYEPLRHYAEVHLLLEPLPEGSGLIFAAGCLPDTLAANWQRLVVSQLMEKTHLGVLTGSPITDMRITLVAGKAHIKHTEGGDFREAAYRALRQGLRSAESILLEPWYEFRLSVQSEQTGRALTDIKRMEGDFSQPVTSGEITTIEGTAPVSEMRGYHTEVMGYTRGKGTLNCIFKGYYPCHNAEKVIEELGYDCDADIENSADSIFCSHGAGVLVKWNEAPKYMHIESGIQFGEKEDKKKPKNNDKNNKIISEYRKREAADKELMEIFERTYGKIKRPEQHALKTEKEPAKKESDKVPKLPIPPKGPEYLIVDGYNIIFAWDELNEAAKENLDLAREKLINILCNYQGYRQCKVILVFDAYRVKGGIGSAKDIPDIQVVYTKEKETADMFIEKTVHNLKGKHRVRVATSDGTEQILIMGNGAVRVSASEFILELKDVLKQIRDKL